MHISTNLSKHGPVGFGQKWVKGIFGILGTSPILYIPLYGHSRLLKAQKMRFCKCVPVTFSWVKICQNTFPSPKHVPIAFGMITICQNTFPSLLTLFCDGNVFWRIENAGNTGKRYLKTMSHRKNCTKKPLNSLKTMPFAWKMVSQSDSPMGEHFSGALVDFPWQIEVK